MAASAVAAVVAAVRGRRAPLVLIDGPSGSGKSTLADAVRANWPGATPDLVRLDDAYPGWSGLELASSQLAHGLIGPNRHGAVGRWRRWDWAGGAPGPIEQLRPGRALIVEGCGAFAVAAHMPDAVRVWIEASDGVRKLRALDRDAGAYDPFWELWERQWRHYVRRTAPAGRATVRVNAPAV